MPDIAGDDSRINKRERMRKQPMSSLSGLGRRWRKIKHGRAPTIGKDDTANYPGDDYYIDLAARPPLSIKFSP
jgi:hypothetical protein